MTSGVCLFACVDAEQRSGLVTVNETDKSQLFYWYFPPENGERSRGKGGVPHLANGEGERGADGKVQWHSRSRGGDVWASMSSG